MARRSVTARILTVAAAFGILAASLLPQPPRIDRPGSDKVAHLAAYGMLAFAGFAAANRRGARAALLVIALCTAYGGLIELIQPLVGRSRELVDLAADFGGASLGAVAALLADRRAAARR